MSSSEGRETAAAVTEKPLSSSTPGGGNLREFWSPVTVAAAMTSEGDGESVSSEGATAHLLIFGAVINEKLVLAAESTLAM